MVDIWLWYMAAVVVYGYRLVVVYGYRLVVVGVKTGGSRVGGPELCV